MNNINYEGIGFNAEWIKSKSESDFLKEADFNKHWFKDDPKRIDKLKEVYALAAGKPLSQKQSDNPGAVQKSEANQESV